MHSLPRTLCPFFFVVALCSAAVVKHEILWAHSPRQCVLLRPDHSDDIGGAMMETCISLPVTLPIYFAFSVSNTLGFAVNLLSSFVETTLPERCPLVLPCIGYDRIQNSMRAAQEGGVETSTFGSVAYYDYLKEKLEYTLKIIHSFAGDWTHESEGTNAEPAVHWIVAMDVDTQVFPGWQQLLYNLTSPPKNNATDLPSNTSGNEQPIAHYQREGGSKLNSGFALLRIDNEHTLKLYQAAAAQFVRRKGGDQTALQKAIRQMGIRIREKRKNASPLRSAPFISLLPKEDVNAATSDSQRVGVLVHHAHMSGKFKRYNMLHVLEQKSSTRFGCTLRDAFAKQWGKAALTDDASFENALAAMKSTVCGTDSSTLAAMEILRMQW